MDGVDKNSMLMDKTRQRSGRVAASKTNTSRFFQRDCFRTVGTERV